MPALSDVPFALIGHPSSAARPFLEVGLIAVPVPGDDLRAVVSACQALRFAGALVHPGSEAAALEAVEPDAGARRVGAVDAVAFAGGRGPAHGTLTLADALTDAVEASGYAARGARALLLGSGADLVRAWPLLRLGLGQLAVAADHLPDAERLTREAPAGVRTFAVSRRDPGLAALAERADLVVLTGGSLPPGLLQPYHTLADLTGRASTGASGASTLDLSALPALRLARQLLHATGQRYRPEDLTGLVAALA